MQEELCPHGCAEIDLKVPHRRFYIMETKSGLTAAKKAASEENLSASITTSIFPCNYIRYDYKGQIRGLIGLNVNRIHIQV